MAAEVVHSTRKINGKHLVDEVLELTDCLDYEVITNDGSILRVDATEKYAYIRREGTKIARGSSAEIYLAGVGYVPLKKALNLTSDVGISLRGLTCLEIEYFDQLKVITLGFFDFSHTRNKIYDSIK